MSVQLEVFVNVNGESTRRVIDAEPTPVAGLVVNENVNASGWVVTHQGAGVAVAKAPGRAEALRLALALGPVCDWTLPAHVIQRRPAIRKRWGDVIAEQGAAGWQEGATITAAQLKSVAP